MKRIWDQNKQDTNCHFSMKKTEAVQIYSSILKSLNDDGDTISCVSLFSLKMEYNFSMLGIDLLFVI
jgi:hypothetical protein